MDTIIETLFINMSDTCPHRPESEKSMQVISDNERELNDRLTGKDKALFRDLVNAYDNLNEDISLDSFVRGFRTGARLMIEIEKEV